MPSTTSTSVTKLSMLLKHLHYSTKRCCCNLLRLACSDIRATAFPENIVISLNFELFAG
jgi:hypothetical protein